jgi:hypothetical protein
VTDPELLEKQARKLRRRIEDFLRHSTPDVLIKIADVCGIKVPKKLRDIYEEK